MLERCCKNSKQCPDNVRECHLNSYIFRIQNQCREVLPWNSHCITSPFVSTEVSLLPPRSLKRRKTGKRRAGNRGKENERLPPSSSVLSLH